MPDVQLRASRTALMLALATRQATAAPESVGMNMRPWFYVVLMSLVGMAVLVVMINSWPIGPDYFVYRDVTRKWLEGSTRLYDSQATNFYNPPWVLLLTIPLTWMPLRLGNAVLNLVSMVLIVASARLFQKTLHLPLYWTVLASITLYACFLLINGQLDAFVLLGLAIGWWSVQRKQALMLGLAFTLMALKPLNVAPVLVLLVAALFGWSPAQRIRVFVIPGVVFVLSLLFAGADWPVRYFENYQLSPPISSGNTTVWRAAEVLGLPAPAVLVLTLALVICLTVVAVRTGITIWALSAVLATTFMVTTYAWNYHYVLLIPALLFIASVKPRLALSIYVLIWSLALRLLAGGACTRKWIFCFQRRCCFPVGGSSFTSALT